MDDRALRARFRALASADAGLVPQLSVATLGAHRAMLRTRRARRRWQSAGTVAVVGAAAGALFLAWPREPRPALDFSSVTWTAPTDFLLDTPGSAYLRSVPTIDMPKAPNVADAADRDDTSRRNQ